VRTSATSRVVIRLIVYYVAMIGGGMLVSQYMPRNAAIVPASVDALFGSGLAPVHSTSTVPLDESSLAITVGIVMLAAALLTLPVAWVYLLTRAKRGYQQSVVQLLITLPLVVAGIVLLVKYSVALAFSLAGIVAAVRFRNTLDDSKDAVYVFLATAIGLAAAVNLPVALVLSMGFNIVALILWYTDFGVAPVELDGRIAERRLARARKLARTGTFVARIDDEVLRNMTKDQLEGVAQRAWKRAGVNDDSKEPTEDGVLSMRTHDAASLRLLVEPRLEEYARSWKLHRTETIDGVDTIEYHVQFKKRTPPDELLSILRAAGSSTLLGAELSS
jgi:hypothetical protein